MRSTAGHVGFGLLGHGSPHEAVACARLCDATGFDSLWIAEDYFYSSAFGLAAACCTVTERISIGIGVVNPYTRHPVLLAIEAATLDHLSRGRTSLGLGQGSRRWIGEQMGIEMCSPIVALRETVALIRGLARSETVSMTGGFVRVHSVKLDVPPQRPDMPIFLGTIGPEGLRLAGEIADGVLLSVLSSPDYVRFALERIREGAGRAGRDLRDFRVALYIPCAIHRDPARAREMVRPTLAKYLGLLGRRPRLSPLFSEAGVDRDALVPFVEATQAGRLAADAVTDSLVETFAIAGSLEECRARIARLLEQGVTDVIPCELVGQSSVELVQSLAPLARD